MNMIMNIRSKNIFSGYQKKWTYDPVSFLIIFLFFVNGVWSASQISKTYDEDTHLEFGLSLLNGNAERPWESVMPISAWNALPKFISAALPNGSVRDILEMHIAARIMSLLFSCGVAYLVFHFSRSLYGLIPAFFSLLLFVFDPNILAHSQLVTTDIYATGALLLTAFSTWRYAQNRNWSNRVLFASSLGFSLVTKFTAMSYIPLFFLILILHDWQRMRNGDRRSGENLRTFHDYVILASLTVVMSVIVLNVAYRFHRSFVPFGEYAFRSEVFDGFQKELPLLNKVPMPVPYAHLQGFDWILAFENSGEGHGYHYFLGELRSGEGFPGYFVVAFLLKEPISSQIIIGLAVILYLLRQDRRSRFWKHEMFLFIPVAFYTIYFNFFYNSQIGIRYYLIIFPLLHIFAGSLFVDWAFLPKRAKLAGALAVVYLVVSTLSYFPYYLPYFNEIIWNRNNAYKYLADSNLDWGQGRDALQKYLIDNPDVSYPTRFVRSGTFVIGANDLVGIKDPAVYAWLRENFEPIDNVAYSYLVFEVTSDSKRELCLNTSYCAGK